MHLNFPSDMCVCVREWCSNKCVLIIQLAILYMFNTRFGCCVCFNGKQPQTHQRTHTHMVPHVYIQMCLFVWDETSTEKIEERIYFNFHVLKSLGYQEWQWLCKWHTKWLNERTNSQSSRQTSGLTKRMTAFVQWFM